MAKQRFDVFLSYASADRISVEQIARSLRARGLKPFLDRWHLAAGQPWTEILEERLSDSAAVGVCIGPNGLGSWQRREMYVALDKQAKAPGFPVIPVLLPGGNDPALSFLFLNTWVDLRDGLEDTTLLDALADAIRGRSPDGALSISDPRAEVCPYRGLSAFREEDAPFFVGREEFIPRLVEAVGHSSLVAVVGPSGSGKSSAVMAGLVPSLRDIHSPPIWDVVSITPGRDPLRALVAALSPPPPDLTRAERIARLTSNTKLLLDGQVSLANLTDDLLNEQPGTDRLLLVIDQWEELYTQTKLETERRAFVDQILDASGGLLSVVITVRADFFARVLEDRGLSDRLRDGVVTLAPMKRTELRRSIVEPAQKLGLEFEDGLDERILDDIGDEPGNLPLLEFLLTELWRRRDRRTMTHASYQSIGGIKGAIATRAEQEFAALDASHKDAARRLLIHLVTPGEGQEDTRARLVLPDDEDALNEVVRRFADQGARLLVTSADPNDRTRTVEVSHEALIQHWGRLRVWVEENRELLRTIKRVRAAKEQWALEDGLQDSRLLPPGRPLEEARDLLAVDDALISDLRPFIEASIRHDEEKVRAEQQRENRQKRRLRAVAVGALVLAAIATAAGGLAWYKVLELDLERDRAQFESRVNLANLMRAQDRLKDAESLLSRTIEDATGKLERTDPVVISATAALATLYADTDRSVEAEKTMIEALNLSRQLASPDRLLEARLQTDLADILRRARRFEDAAEMYLESAAFIETHIGSRHPLFALSLREAGKILRKLDGRLDDAVEQLEKAIAGFSESVGPSHPQHALTELALADAYYTAGNVAAASMVAADGLAVLRERHQSPDLTASMIEDELLRRLACRDIPTTDLVAISEPAMVTFEYMQQLLALQEAQSTDSIRDLAIEADVGAKQTWQVMSRLLVEWREADARRDPMLLEVGLASANDWTSQQASAERLLAKAADKIGAAEAQLLRSSPFFHHYSARVDASVSAVADSLDESEAFLFVVTSDGATFLAVVRKSSVRMTAVPVSGSSLARVRDRAIRSLASHQGLEYQAFDLAWLYDALIRPIKSDLSGIDRLVISASPDAQLVPWHLLLELDEAQEFKIPRTIGRAVTGGTVAPFLSLRLSNTEKATALDFLVPFPNAGLSPSPSGAPTLQRIADALNKGELLPARGEVRARATVSSSEKHNALVGCRRAFSIIEALTEHDVNPARLVPIGIGSDESGISESDIEIVLSGSAPDDSENGSQAPLRPPAKRPSPDPSATRALRPLAPPELPIESARHVVESYSVHLQPSPAFFVHSRHRPCPDPPSRSLLGIAPEFLPLPMRPIRETRGFGLASARPWMLPPIPLAQEELKRIQSLVGDGTELVLLGSHGTMENLLRIETGEFHYVVFATHGVTAAESPDGYPGVVLLSVSQTEGPIVKVLDAPEILGMHFNSEVVILSASNTLVDGGVEGISRTVKALLSSGSQAVLGTYWSPSDESAADFTTEFFRRIDSSDPGRVADAARAAMLELKGSDKYRNRVSLWGAYGLVGDGASRCFR